MDEESDSDEDKSESDKSESDRSELDEGKIIRQKLGAVFHLIRFAAMSAKDFFEFVGNKNTKILITLIIYFRSNWRT